MQPQTIGTACPEHLLRDWVAAHRRLRVVVEVTERDLCDAPGDLLRVAATLHELGWDIALDDVGANDAGVALLLRGSAGVGVVHGAIPAEADPAAVAGVVTRLRAECTALGGSLVVLDGPAAVKAAVDPWGPVPAIDLMRRVKAQFDPERRLAPGRFVGGI